MKYFLLVIVTLVLLFSGCREPVEKENPYRQEAIPWPSLANSPWPMYMQNPQNTGTNYSCPPVQGTDLSTMLLPFYNESYANIITDTDSAYYVSAFWDKSVNKFCVSDQRNWSVSFNELVVSTPILLSNGTLIAATNEVKSINQDGSVNWTIQLQGQVFGGLNVDLGGNILCIDDSGVLTSISSAGTINWQQQNTNDVNINVGPTISPGGSQIYTCGGKLTAYNVSTGDTIWTYDNEQLVGNAVSSSAVDNDGNIYFVSWFDSTAIVYSVSDQGNLNWSYQVGVSDDFYLSTSPVLTFDNKMIFTVGPAIYGFTLAGEQVFESPIPSSCTGSGCADKEGNVYFATTVRGLPFLLSFTSNGELRFSIDLPGEVDSGLSLFHSKIWFISYNYLGESILCIVE